jgi:ATP-binding cassette subfamily B protein
MSHYSGWMMLGSLRREGELAGKKVGFATARRVAAFARPYRAQIVVFLVTVVVSAAIGVANPVLAGDVVNAITKGGADAGGTVVRIALLIAGLAIADALLSLVQRWYSGAHRRGHHLRPAHPRVRPRAADAAAVLHPHPDRRPGAAGLNNDVIGAQQAFTSTLSGVGRATSSSWCSPRRDVHAVLADHRAVAGAAAGLHPAGAPVGRRLAEITRESYQLDAKMNATMTERFGVAGRCW